MYVEPKDFFPKELRKKHKLGEYADKSSTAKKSEKKPTPKKTTKK